MDIGRAERAHHALMKELERCAEVIVTGVVGGSGASLIRMEGETRWTLILTFDAWRVDGGPLRERPLTLRCSVGEGDSRRVAASIDVLDVLRVRARIAEASSVGTPQGLLTGIKGKVSGDEEFDAVVRRLREPVTFEDERLGTFTLDRGLRRFAGGGVWAGERIEVSVDGVDVGACAKMLAGARGLWDREREWHTRTVEFAATKMLGLKNESWLDEGESPIDAAEFARRLRLESITLGEAGAFTFYFDDGELFWGHMVAVSGTLRDGPRDAEMMG